MAPRPKQTLMDFMVIAISPALIMGMVGSLLFFLLTVFYQGQYGARLDFIFAMFTLAIVLIARISMEEGTEYASMFGIPLAIVTALAMMRFVEFRGPLAPFTLLINGGLIALVWWSAHKLTWDCTYIDDSQDASGEGLLQGMGFDAETVERQAEVAATAAGASSERDQDAGPASGPQTGPEWYRRMIRRRRRPHTPGVWVIYYALAALPLFVVGESLLQAGDMNSRHRAFCLLCVYVGCALGLLLTTSFLGLRRYLRQRHVRMPVEIAGLWLGLGTALVLALLLVCLILPRPGASLPISQLPFVMGSPGGLSTQPSAPGRDGPERPKEATRTRPEEEASKVQPGQPSAPDAPPQPGQTSPGSATSAQPPPPRESSQGSATSAPAPPRESSQQKTQTDGRAAEPSPAKPQPSEPTPEPPEGQRPEPRPLQESSQQPTPGEPPQEKSFPRQEQPPSEKQTGPSEPPPASPGGSPPHQRSSERGEPKQDASEPPSGQQNAARPAPQEPAAQEKETASPEQRDAARSSRRFDASQLTRVLPRVASGLGNFLKLVFLAALLAAFLCATWKYRNEIRTAVAQLVADLQRLWARLWGARTGADDAAEPTSTPVAGPLLPPFASFADPFATGRAERFSTEQLVQYSFEALEAWGRDHGCPRGSEQTPLEFARDLAATHRRLARETQVLAELFSRMVYGRERIPARWRDDLRRLWQQLRAPP